MLFRKKIVDKILSLRDLIFPGEWEVVLYNEGCDWIFENINLNELLCISGKFGFYYADPFIVEDDGILKILCEEYSYLSRRGRVVEFLVDLSGKIILSKKCLLDGLFHYSFPNLVSINGVTYLIPEQQSTRAITAYELNKINNSYELISDIDAVDHSFHLDLPYIFLFTSLPNGGGVDGRGDVSVFYAEIGEFPHCKWIPVEVIKDEFGRNAGNIFKYNGELYRPVQISVRSYGEKVAIKKIINISENYYEEALSNVINGRLFNGTHVHTLNFSKNFTVIDRRRISVAGVIRTHFGRMVSLLSACANFFWIKRNI